jgi:hypothetical protein
VVAQEQLGWLAYAIFWTAVIPTRSSGPPSSLPDLLDRGHRRAAG